MKLLKIKSNGGYYPPVIYFNSQGGDKAIKKAIRELNEFANLDGTRSDLKVRAYPKRGERKRAKERQHKTDLKREAAREERSEAYYKRREALKKRGHPDK